MSTQLVLLNIKFDEGTVEISGPVLPRSGLTSGISVNNCGKLCLSGSVKLRDIKYTSTDGVTNNWDAQLSEGPLFFEDVTYHIWINGNEEAPSIEHRDPLFSKNITTRPSHKNCSGTFNLGRQIGTLPIALTFGDKNLLIELEISPTKIDYKTDYLDILEDVTSSARGLALEYVRTTHTRADRLNTPASGVEWLSGVRQELEELDRAVRHINRSPYKQLTQKSRPTAIHKVKKSNSKTRKAILCGKGTGSLEFIPGVGSVRRTIDYARTADSLDTNEHRWLRTQISQIHDQLQRIRTQFVNNSSRYRKNGLGKRQLKVIHEISELTKITTNMLQYDFLRKSTSDFRLSVPSLTLLSAPGYREAFQILTGLRLGFSLAGDALEMQLKDIHQLYEIWTFIKVVDIITEQFGSKRDVSELIKINRGALHVSLTAGAKSEIRLFCDNRELTVTYNPTFAGDTGDQTPDIVITIREPNRASLFVVLDAKYRLDSTQEFQNKFGAPGPPLDAINALHRYRDAIVTFQPESIRPVVRGAALFPLPANEVNTYVQHSSLYKSLFTLGIGAIPFLPSNTEALTNWLKQLLALPSDELAWNGPCSPQDANLKFTGTTIK